MTPINTDDVKGKYKIVFDPADAKKWCVELLPGCDPFHGIIVSFGEFKMKPGDDSNPVPKFSFETEIIFVPDRLKDVTFPDEAEEQIQNLLAKILIDIIETHKNSAKSEDGKLFLELAKPDDK